MSPPKSAYGSVCAYIIDPDLDRRMRLKQATVSLPAFGNTTGFATTTEALSKWEVDSHAELMLISSRFPPESIRDFISKGKASHGKHGTFVLILDVKEQGSPRLAEYLLWGVDGFLYEPYSMDGLMDTVALAAKLRNERRAQREKVAITLLTRDLIKQLDVVSLLKSFGSSATRAQERFAKIGEILRTLSLDSLEIYFDVAVQEFQEAPLPKKAFQMTSYSGASSRVKKLMEDKYVAELEAQQVEIEKSLGATAKDLPKKKG